MAQPVTSASDTLVIAQLASDVLRLEERVATYRAMVSVSLDQQQESVRRVGALEEQMRALKDEIQRYVRARV